MNYRITIAILAIVAASCSGDTTPTSTYDDSHSCYYHDDDTDHYDDHINRRPPNL